GTHPRSLCVEIRGGWRGGSTTDGTCPPRPVADGPTCGTASMLDRFISSPSTPRRTSRVQRRQTQ
ncbi:unnamed protein product, partial [Symbiodinium sp. KB8]